MAGFMTGRGATLSLFIGGNKAAALDVETWDLSQEAEDIADGVNGEDRDRLDKEIKFYKLSLECFNATTDKLKQLLAYDADLDDDAQDDVSFGIKLRDKSGNSDIFALTECTLDNWKWASGGRTSRMKLSIPIRGRYFTPLSP
jgi:hypothetical protein